MVITDTANPEAEGKVFLFQYGKKIFDKIKDVMQPQFEDEEPMNPFDFWKGANFKLKIRQVEGYRNYDKSEFEESSALSDDDEYLEGVYNKLYSLEEFIDPKNYKSYEELEKKLISVLGAHVVKPDTRSTVELEETQEPQQMKEVKPSSDDSDDDESLSYFAKLAQEE